jgi:hypothetical protein
LSAVQIDGAFGFILEELRKWLLTERDRLAEAKFREDVAAERIQFRLRADQTARLLWRRIGQ